MQRVKRKDLEKIRDELIEKQGGRCAICGQWFAEYPKRDIVVDHDHVTGVIRGALCRNCNRAEGKVRTQCVSAKRQSTPLKWLIKLCKYLILHNEPQTEWLHPTYKSPEELQEIKREKQRMYYARRRAVANLKSNKKANRARE